MSSPQSDLGNHLLSQLAEEELIEYGVDEGNSSPSSAQMAGERHWKEGHIIPQSENTSWVAVSIIIYSLIHSKTDKTPIRLLKILPTLRRGGVGCVPSGRGSHRSATDGSLGNLWSRDTMPPPPQYQRSKRQEPIRKKSLKSTFKEI